LLGWALGTNMESMSGAQVGCNNDVMIHSGKGVTGIRIDGVQDVTMNNIYIYDIVESTPLGKMDCGNYGTFNGGESGLAGGHFRQTFPMQYGFSGNMLQGVTINAARNITLKNLYVNDLESAYGPTFGIALWPATNVSLQGEIEFTNLKAGSLFVNDGSYFYNFSNTNKLPEVCGLRVQESYTTSGYTYVAGVQLDSTVKATCITGSVNCFGGNEVSMMGGDFYSCTSALENQSTHVNIFGPIILPISIVAMIGIILFILYQKYSHSKRIKYSLLPKEDPNIVIINYHSIQY